MCLSSRGWSMESLVRLLTPSTWQLPGPPLRCGSASAGRCQAAPCPLHEQHPPTSGTDTPPHSVSHLAPLRVRGPLLRDVPADYDYWLGCDVCGLAAGGAQPPFGLLELLWRRRP